VVSHTAALAGSDASYGAFLEHCGVLRMPDLATMFTCAQGLLQAGPLAGNRAGVVTMSGGISSVMADACTAAGLEVPALPDEFQAELSEVVPEFGAVRNPIDLTTAVNRDTEMAARVFDVLRRSGAVDVIILQMTSNADPPAAKIAGSLVEARSKPGPPFILGRIGAPSWAPRAMEVYAEAGIHVYTWPEQTVQAAAACVRYGRFLARASD
jgi:acyl-CoA synthetase (NDP forming)